MEVLTKVMFVIILQYISVSNHYILHLKLLQESYVNYISIKLGKRKKKYLPFPQKNHKPSFLWVSSLSLEECILTNWI